MLAASSAPFSLFCDDAWLEPGVVGRLHEAIVELDAGWSARPSRPVLPARPPTGRARTVRAVGRPEPELIEPGLPAWQRWTCITPRTRYTWLAATCGRTSAGSPTRSPGWAAACCTNAPCSTPSGLRLLARPACRALRRRCAGAAQGAGAGWRGRHNSVRSGAFGVAHDRAGPRYAFHWCSPAAHRAPCGGRTSRFAPSRRGPGRARRDERSDLAQLGQLCGGTIPARQVAPQPALPRPARQPVLRGARRQQFGRRRAGVMGPTIREPHRLGFGLAGSDSAVAAGVTAPPRATRRSADCHSMRCRRATRWVSGGSRRRRRARSARPRGRNRWSRPPWPTR